MFLPPFRPDSCPNTSRYERPEKGLFRYRKTGETWHVQRQGGKVRWRNLKTKDPIMAREKLFNLSPFEVAHKQMQVVIKPSVPRTRHRRPSPPPAQAAGNLRPNPHAGWMLRCLETHLDMLAGHS